MRDASWLRGDVVLDEHAVFEHADLDAAALRAHDHLTRSTHSRRARNSDSVMTGRRRPASRPSRRRCFFASRRVEPLTRCGSVISSGSRGLRTLHDGVGGLVAGGRRSSPLRRRVRRRTLDDSLDVGAPPVALAALGCARARSTVGTSTGGAWKISDVVVSVAGIGETGCASARSSAASASAAVLDVSASAARGVAVGLPSAARRGVGLGRRRDRPARLGVASSAARRRGVDRLGLRSAPGRRRPRLRAGAEQAATSLRALLLDRVRSCCSRCLPPSLVHSYAGSGGRATLPYSLERSCAVRGTANPSLLRPAGCLCRHVSRCVSTASLRMRCIRQSLRWRRSGRGPDDSLDYRTHLAGSRANRACHNPNMPDAPLAIPTRRPRHLPHRRRRPRPARGVRARARQGRAAGGSRRRSRPATSACSSVRREPRRRGRARCSGSRTRSSASWRGRRPITIGVALLAGATFARWFWIAFNVGVAGALVFVGWLIAQSIYVLDVLCPWCMLTWAVTIPLFWVVTLYNLRTRTYSGIGTCAAARRRLVRLDPAHHRRLLRHRRPARAGADERDPARHDRPAEPLPLTPDAADARGTGAGAGRRSAGAASDQANQSASSRSADSAESEPCTRFCCTLRPQSRPRSPRIVPGAAVVGSVVPASDAEALDHAVAGDAHRDDGPGLHELDERLVERLALVLRVVRRRAARGRPAPSGCRRASSPSPRCGAGSRR